MASKKIQYLNTDLVIESTDDLTNLSTALEQTDALVLYNDPTADGGWEALIEAGGEVGSPQDGGDYSPDGHISWFLDCIEALPAELQAVWRRSAVREFDLGFRCGFRPFGYQEVVSSAVLQRLVDHCASLRITIYPPFRMRTDPPGAVWRRYPRRRTRQFPIERAPGCCCSRPQAAGTPHIPGHPTAVSG